MDVRFSPEQLALRDSVASVVDRLGPRTVRDFDDVERRDKLDAAVEASGWRELRCADEGEGPLASGVEAAIVAEELARGLADTSFVGPTLAAELRRMSGVPPAASLETVALSRDLATPADGVRDALSFDALGAASVLVLQGVPGGHELGVLKVGPTSSGADLTRHEARLDPDAPVETLVADRGIGAGDLQKWTALGLALGCADLVGVMRGAIGMACRYASNRRQFGVAVASFQAVQHMLADAAVAVEGAKSVALHGAWAVDALPPAEALTAASVAKAYCARAARSVCEAGIQVHGGIGHTWDCMAHVYLRRALCSSDFLGGVGPSLARVLEDRGIQQGEVGSGHGIR